MSINYNPKIVTDGLVLCLDAANAKSFDANENLLTYSEQLDNVAWTKTRGSAVSNTAIAPDNTLTADSFIEDTTATSSHYFFGSAVTLTIGLTYTFSCYVKANGRNFIAVQGDIGQGNLGGPTGFDLSTGVYTLGASVTSASITNVGSGWYRISVTAVATGINAYAGMALRTSYGVGIQTYTGDGTSGIYIWGAQFERASSASRYYATTGSAKNRGTSLTDISGNGNNATLVNGPTYNPSNNGKLVFDGVDDYSRPNISHSYLSSSALEIWFNSASHGTGFKTLFGYAHPNGYSRPVAGEMYLTGNTLAASVITSTQTYREVTFPTSISTNTFYYAVLNKDTVNGTLQLFVNGVAGSTQTFDVATYAQWPSAGVYQGTNVLDIAKSANVQVGQGWENAYFNGSIFRLGVYNRILTLTEIQQNFNALRGRFGI